MTTSVTSTTSAQTTSSAAASAASRIAGDMQNFLQLLTTQLQNQDPTKPLDPNEFTAQLAQFAGVEQQIAANRHMEQLLELQRTSAMLSAAPLLGRSVEVSSDRIALQSGTAQPIRLPSLSEAGGAQQARIAVMNADGTVIRESFVRLDPAETDWRWDGRDSRGQIMADGTWRISVTGIDAQGVSRGALDIGVIGTVTSVTRQGTAPTLALGSLNVGLEALRELRQ